MVNKKNPDYKKKQQEKKIQRKQQCLASNDESRKRSKEERQFESLNVIHQLKQNNISSEYPAIKELLYKLQTYVSSGEKMEFNIPFPEMRKVIKGYLPIYKDEECVVVLRHTE